jgi:hypothetical protein
MRDGWDNFSHAFTGLDSIVKKHLLRRKEVDPFESISLRGRFKLGCAGIGLMVPVINMLVYWALRKDAPPEALNGVRFDRARIREFDKNLAPNHIGEITSFHNPL